MMRWFVVGGLIMLAGCTQQHAKETAQAVATQAQIDAKAVAAQVQEDGEFVAGETQANAEQVAANVEAKLKRIADNVRDQTKKTNRKLRDWWLTPLPEPEPTPVPSSYCYTVLQDILCYRQPVAGWEHRLAGYQGSGAEAPAAAMMRPLPTRSVDTSKSAENRVAGAKPVFVELPPEEKKPDTEGQPAAVDPANENLPDPALSPQL